MCPQPWYILAAVCFRIFAAAVQEIPVQLFRSRNKVLLAMLALVTSFVVASLLSAQNRSHVITGALRAACPADDSGLTLPAGFCATIFADGIGHARHKIGRAHV
jgi:hypothetical protein